MSNIQITILGGNDEIGKNCIAINIAGKYYIMNCGSRLSVGKEFGVSHAIVNTAWFSQNAANINGIFISSANSNNAGAIRFITKKVPDIKVYCSKISSLMIEAMVANSPNKPQMNVVDHLKSIDFGDVTVTPFAAPNSMPLSLGYIISTKEENIIFVSDFIVSSSSNKMFFDDFDHINDITKGNNTILITSASGLLPDRNYGYVSPFHRIKKFFDDFFSTVTKRIIVAAYDTDIFRLLSLIGSATENKKKIYINSKQVLDIVHQLQQEKKFINKPIEFITKEQITETNDVLIILVNPIDELFNYVEELVEAGDEEGKLNFSTQDEFLFISDTVSGFERQEADMLNSIVSKFGIKTNKVPSTIKPMVAYDEDHKHIVKLLRPKYIIPTSGLFMNFMQYCQIMREIGFFEAVHILENTQQVWINNQVLDTTYHNDPGISPDDCEEFISPQGTVDISSSVFFERQRINQNGAILISLFYNTSEKRIVDVKINQIGLPDNNDGEWGRVCNEITKELPKLIVWFGDGLDVKHTKEEIRKYISRVVRKAFNKDPLVLHTIIFADRWQQKK